MTIHFHIPAVVICLSMMMSLVVNAQDSQKDKDDAEAAKLRVLLDRTMETFEVVSKRSDKTAMTPKPVLRWTNEERDSHSVGLLVLFIDRGQPAAVIASYTWAGQLHHEFDALSREPVIAKEGATSVWMPRTGIKFRPIPKAPAVESSPAARLRQMKALSEEFNATMMGWRADKSDRAELRRLPRELFRYQPENSEVIDGAVFGYVQGIDPEALLLIEAVKVGDSSEWQYAFSPQSSGELQGRHHDQIVWTEIAHRNRRDPTAAGFSITSTVDLKKELAK